MLWCRLRLDAGYGGRAEPWDQARAVLLPMYLSVGRRLNQQGIGRLHWPEKGYRDGGPSCRGRFIPQYLLLGLLWDQTSTPAAACTIVSQSLLFT